MKGAPLKPREKRLIAVLAVVGVSSALLYFFHFRPAGSTEPRARAANDALPEAIPRIDLDRLPRERPEREGSKRDIFAFGPPPTLRPTRAPDPPPTPVTEATPYVPTPPPIPRLPPLKVKFIGSVENGRGARVAVLLTDKNEILTGQAGEVLANRYKIAKIGFESVDLEEVGTGQVQRLPLKN